MVRVRVRVKVRVRVRVRVRVGVRIRVRGLGFSVDKQTTRLVSRKVENIHVLLAQTLQNTSIRVMV